MYFAQIYFTVLEVQVDERSVLQQPNSRHAINWPNGDPMHCRIYASPDHSLSSLSLSNSHSYTLLADRSEYVAE